jgi:hypothetical protein
MEYEAKHEKAVWQERLTQVTNVRVVQSRKIVRDVTNVGRAVSSAKSFRKSNQSPKLIGCVRNASASHSRSDPTSTKVKIPTHDRCLSSHG